VVVAVAEGVTDVAVVVGVSTGTTDVVADAVGDVFIGVVGEVDVIAEVQLDTNNKIVARMLNTGKSLPDFSFLLLIPLYPHNSRNFQENRGSGGVGSLYPGILLPVTGLFKKRNLKCGSYYPAHFYYIHVYYILSIIPNIILGIVIIM
jgi:hypothetical protein